MERLVFTKDGAETKRCYRVDCYWLLADGYKADNPKFQLTETEETYVKNMKKLNEEKAKKLAPKEYEDFNVNELKAHVKAEKIEYEFKAGRTADEVRADLAELAKE